jgi:predicted RND superfamily exporter protein
MIFLPVVTLVSYKWIDKTMHREFMPHHGGISKLLLKVRTPLLLISLIVLVPAFLGQSKVPFLYGMGVDSQESRSYIDQEAIKEVFGDANPLLLIIPRNSVAKENQLGKALKEIDHVTRVISYAEMVGTRIPSTFVPEVALNNFYSDNYARIILYTNLEAEGDVTFKTMDQIMEVTGTYYDEFYLTGESASLNDMKNVVAVDMGRINLIAVIGIFIVLLFAFRSLTIPILLIFTIESAIWMNLSIPYFINAPISFIGYLIISTVQLGATVDYAILMTNRYLEERQMEPKKEAMWKALKNNVGAILISAAILATAGFTLAGTTNNPVIKELGTLLGRGTVLSFVMVVAVLPALLLIFDKVIQKTTWSHGFYQDKEVQ